MDKGEREARVIEERRRGKVTDQGEGPMPSSKQTMGEFPGLYRICNSSRQNTDTLPLPLSDRQAY
jgi:hypothetical protein